MTLDLYSELLSIALIALTVGTVVSMILYFASSVAKQKLQSIGYTNYLLLIGAFAAIATVGALTYQYAYQTPVCEFCWWQRIFMFPITIIALLAVANKIKGTEAIIAVLSMLGALTAAYHYYFHFQISVLGNILSMPCSAVGLVPSCTETPILVFGFITIPLMALIPFLVILWLVFLASKAAK